MDKNILNQNEKNEITNDVKNAFKQAKYKNNGGINKKTLVLSIVIIVIIFTGCIYFFLNNNPKNIFINNVNFIYKSVIITDLRLACLFTFVKKINNYSYF